MAEKTSTYSVKVDSNAKTVGDEGAAALERLRASIQNSQSSIRTMSESMKALRGVTDEVKSQKDKLRAAIEAERSSISGATSELLKHGTSYGQLTDQVKKAAAETAKMKAGEAVKAAGGPVEELSGKFEKLKTAMGSSAGVAALVVGAMVAVVAGAVELGRAIADTTAELLKWVFATGLLTRQQALQREAWTGSAKDATALGHQLDALANKVPTARAELEKLAGQVVKGMNNARVSGQGMVDTINAVAQASAAMGDEVGAKLLELVNRAKLTGRAFATALDFQGTGLKVQDVGAQLAKSMGIGVAQAVAALQQGRVGVNDFAAALRAAAEVRFGNVNALLRLGQIAENFQKRLQALTSTIDWKPMLDAIEDISKLFDQSTVSGSVLRTMVEALVGNLGKGLKGAVPVIKEVFERLELGAIKIEIAILKAGRAIRAAFSDQEKARALAATLSLIDEAGREIAASAGGLATIAIGIGKAILAIQDFAQVFLQLGTAIRTTAKDWYASGASLVDGLIEGIKSRLAAVKGAVLNLGATIRDAFKGALGISSPSKVFESYGQNTGEGYERGVAKSSSGAQAAVEKMAPSAPAAASGGAARGGRGGASGATVNVNLHAGSKAAAEEMSKPSFLASITKAVEDGLVSAGIGPQAEPTP